MKKIDIHVHVIYPRDEMEKKREIPRPGSQYTFADPEELIALYDRLGIEKGILLPLVSPEGMHRTISNEETYAIVEKYPDRFDWFCSLDPRWDTNKEDTDLGYFIEHYKSLGAKGIGEVTSNLEFDDPKVQNLLYYAQKHNMPFLFHIAAKNDPYGLKDDLGLPRLERMLKTFSKLTFIGHSASFWSEISKDVKEENRGTYVGGPVVAGGRIPYFMENYPNLLLDISANSGFNAISRDPDFGYAFLERYQDRILYGTDICAPIEYNFYGMEDFLQAGIKKKSLSLQAYYKIIRVNAEKLLGYDKD